MKLNSLFSALSTAVPVFLLSGTAFATEPSSAGHGTVVISSKVGGNFAVGLSGTSTSFAQNTEAARAKVTGSAGYTPGYNEVNVAVGGTTLTESAGKAYNISTGSGTGGAMSKGMTDASVNGQANIHAVSTGFNGGGSGTHSTNVIVAGANQGSYVAGQATSGFDTQLNYAQTYSSSPVTGFIGHARESGVSISGLTSGYASGANTSGALQGMNAAGLANIGAAGDFFSKLKMIGHTGVSIAP